MKSPSIFEGLLRFQEFFLNQPHPSMPSKSLSDSDRYELDSFFTKMRIPQLSLKCNQLISFLTCLLLTAWLLSQDFGSESGCRMSPQCQRVRFTSLQPAFRDVVEAAGT
jgi:hypothetical protein